MAEREVVLDQPVIVDEQAEALRHATERAELAEAELAKLKKGAKMNTAKENSANPGSAAETDLKQPPSPSSATGEASVAGGEDELRKDSMMAHLLDSLEAGKDIGHYGRLVFAMVARHFMPHDEVMAWMMKDRDVEEEKARLMLTQVEGKDYSPPRRDKILSYQAQQEFPIIPNPDDPDSGNLYKNLKFPDEIYEHIGHYQEAKTSAS